jgi:hypothetical protein
MTIRLSSVILLLLTGVGCGEVLPTDVVGYEDRCVQLNVERIAPTHCRQPGCDDPETDDPHDGFKNVYACGLDEAAIIARQPGEAWPDGTMIVKESTKAVQGHVWLIATMQKTAGSWAWAEYTRNFDGEDFRKVPVAQEFCIDCHRKVQVADYVYTVYEAR